MISLNGMSKLFSSLESRPSSLAACLKFLLVAANAFMLFDEISLQKRTINGIWKTNGMSKNPEILTKRARRSINKSNLFKKTKNIFFYLPKKQQNIVPRRGRPSSGGVSS